MILHVFESLRWQIAHHKLVAAGILAVGAATTIWSLGAMLTGRGYSSAASTATSDSLSAAESENPQGPGDRATLRDVLKFGQKSHTALKSVADYTAVLTKTERIQGDLVTQTIDFKCRRQPFSVYLRNHRRGGKGREVIYVAGANDGDLLVHEAGMKSIIGTLKLKPDSPKVFETSRHPLTDIGLVRLIELAMDRWRIDQREANPAAMDVRFFHGVKVGTAVCDEVQICHRERNPKIDYQVGRVYVDVETGFPIQAEVYGWPDRPGEDPPLLEKYTYTEIKTNVGLTDHDFDPQNSDYKFVLR